MGDRFIPWPFDDELNKVNTIGQGQDATTSQFDELTKPDAAGFRVPSSSYDDTVASMIASRDQAFQELRRVS